MSASAPPASTPLALLIERIAAVLAGRAEVLEAYVFGSTARGQAQAHSDVDVAVYLNPAALPRSGYGARADLTAELMRALASDRVDVAVLNDASPLLYHRVLRDGVRILTRDVQRTTTREGRALSRYCDYVPQLAKIASARAGRGPAAT